MTAIRFGVRGQCQCKILFGLARKPLLLFGHCGGVGVEEGQSVKDIMEYEVVLLWRGIMNCLPGSIEVLQSQLVVSKIGVRSGPIPAKRQALLRDVNGLFVLRL